MQARCHGFDPRLLHVFACSEDNCDFVAERKILLASHIRWKHKLRSLKITCERCQRQITLAQKVRHDLSCQRINHCKHCGIATRNPIFCSRSCAVSTHNSEKKTGFCAYRKKRNLQIIGSDYSLICFKHWPRQCAICGWDLCLEVHHIDRNRRNNAVTNLIPLCPNHHSMSEKKQYRATIDELVSKLVSEKFVHL